MPEIFTINSIASQFGGPILKKFIWWSCLDIPKLVIIYKSLTLMAGFFLFIDRTFVYRGGEGAKGRGGEGFSVSSVTSTFIFISDFIEATFRARCLKLHRGVRPLALSPRPSNRKKITGHY
jgi:hypothetical protein